MPNFPLWEKVAKYLINHTDLSSLQIPSNVLRQEFYNYFSLMNKGRDLDEDEMQQWWENINIMMLFMIQEFCQPPHPSIHAR